MEASGTHTMVSNVEIPKDTCRMTAAAIAPKAIRCLVVTKDHFFNTNTKISVAVVIAK